VKAVADAVAEKRMAGKGVKMSCEGITDLTDKKHEELSKGERGTPIYCIECEDLEAARNLQSMYA
jgi:hypothetical protein